MSKCNTTAIDNGDAAVKTEVPLFGSVTFHHLGLFISAAFGLAACAVASILLIGHATHYSRPWEQKHIIRILAMIPIYAIISFVSFYDYWHAIYWQVLRDCYEAFAIASFFTLLCHYIEPTLHDQKDYFRKLKPRNWVLPISWMQKCTGGSEKGPFRRPRSGLTVFNIIWIGVFQYCFIRVFFTFVAMITQFLGRYCEPSISPAFAHVWVLCFEGAAVTVAMYCLIQFYLQIKDDIAEYKPFLKICCIKLVIFFSFWQSLLISFLTSSHSGTGGILKPSSKVAFADLLFGIPSMLLCIEMFFFSLLHIVAFPWKPYDIRKSPDPSAHHQGGTLGWRAFLDAFNPWDIIKASARGFRWLFVGRRHREDDISYQESTKMKNFEQNRRVETDDSSGAPSIPIPGTFDGGKDGRDPRFQRPGDAEYNYNEDHAGLLSHAQDVPTINVRAPSPFRDASPDSRLTREESPYGAAPSYHAAPYPRESVQGRPQRYGGGVAAPSARYPDAEYEDGMYTPPSPIDTPPDGGMRPAARLPDEEADLGYYGAGGVRRGNR